MRVSYGSSVSKTRKRGRRRAHSVRKRRKNPDVHDGHALRHCLRRFLLPQQRTCRGRDFTHRQPQQEADVDADVDPILPGAAGRRLWLRCTALHTRPEGQVLAQLREVAGHSPGTLSMNRRGSVARTTGRKTRASCRRACRQRCGSRCRRPAAANGRQPPERAGSVARNMHRGGFRWQSPLEREKTKTKTNGGDPQIAQI